MDTRTKTAARVIYVTGLLQGVVGVAFPASAVVLRGRGLGDAQYGSLFVPQMALAALGAAGAGFVLARVGARRALAGGTLLMGLSQAALAASAFVPAPVAYAVALLGTSLLGTGAGLTAGPLNAYPQMLFPGRSETAVVVLHAAQAAGLAAGPLAAAAALAAGAWIAFPLSLLALHFVLWRRVQRAPLPPAEPHGEGAAPRRPTASRALWAFVAIAGLYGLTECQYGNWGIVFLNEERGLSPAQAAAALAAFWAALGLGRLGVAALLLKLRAAPLLPVLGGLMALATLLVPLARSPGSALLLFALGGLGCSAVFPLALGLAGRRFPEHRAWVAGAMFAALVVGLGVGSFATGVLRASLPLEAVYRLAAVPSALAGVLAAALARRESGPAAADAAAPA